MARLMNSANQVLLEDLRIAKSFWSRTRGLLGTSSLGDAEGLWIDPCNSIHTFFMKYPIDCVFVDRAMQVKALKASVLPGRLVLPIWGARSVIEMKAGKIQKLGLSLGDQLYVGA
jgi:uncharacterized membrane protein (UPF0127 family)